MAYRVFQRELDTVILLLKTDDRGMLFYITGDVIAASDMRYERDNRIIIESEAFRSPQIGWVPGPWLVTPYHSGRIRKILGSISKTDQIARTYLGNFGSQTQS